MMTNRFIRIVVICLLAVAAAYVAEPYFVAWRFSATSPRTIAPRADLTEAERTRIKLFQSVSPSVVSVFARLAPQNVFTPGQ
ncbi:MAG: 2-alkenal reductase, partial [Methylocella sp.]